MNTPLQHAPMQQQEEESINLRELLDKYLYHWKWFLIGGFIALSIAFVYLRYSVPVYESKASVLIKDDKKGGGIQGMDMFKDLGILGGSVNLDNEIEIYRSRTLLERVVKKLKLNYSFGLIGDNSGFIRGEVYGNVPIAFEAIGNDSLFFEKKGAFEIELLNEKEFKIAIEDGKSLGTYPYGAVVKSPVGRFIIAKTSELSTKWFGRSILLIISPLEDVVSELQKALNIESASKEAMVLNISMRGVNIDKNNDIINELIAQHEIDAIEDKNQVATTTSEFIQERMKFIAAELSDVEDVGQDYKTKHKLVDVASDAAMYLTKESETEKAITEASIQLSLADFMNEHIQKYQGYSELLPSNLGFKDQSIVLMTTQYNELVLERNKLLQNSGEKNPTVQKIEGQLAGLKSSIIASLKNTSTSLQLELKKLKSQEDLYQAKISTIPQFEREYRDILRQQQIKETLFLYLLQKREENEITLAASVANTKVVDYAYSDGEPVSPKKKIIFLGAFLLGLIIPAGCIYIWELLDSKVHDSKDIDELNLPLVGELPINEEKEKIIAFRNSKSIISEAFRLVRSNISFMINGEAGKCKTILVTSTIAGEGKSFVSLNLGHIYSNSGKKTVVIGMDLRIPTLDKYANISSNAGVSDFIVNESLELDDILIQDDNDENLFYILSGTIPPNPSELLMRERLNQLFDLLKERFDYVIVDTAPLGLVSDTLLVCGFADLVIYVVRANFIDKRNLFLPQKLFKENKLGAMAVLLNGVNMKGKGYRYRYGVYGIQNEKPKKWFFKRN